MLVKQWKTNQLANIDAEYLNSSILSSIADTGILTVRKYSPYNFTITDIIAMDFPTYIPAMNEEDLRKTISVMEDILRAALVQGAGTDYTYAGLFSLCKSLPESIRNQAISAHDIILEDAPYAQGHNLRFSGFSTFRQRYERVIHPASSILCNSAEWGSGIPESFYDRDDFLFIDPNAEHTVNEDHFLRKLLPHRKHITRATTALDTATWLIQNFPEADGSVVTALSIALATPHPSWETMPAEQVYKATLKSFVRYVRELMAMSDPRRFFRIVNADNFHYLHSLRKNYDVLLECQSPANFVKNFICAPSVVSSFLCSLLIAEDGLKRKLRVCVDLTSAEQKLIVVDSIKRKLVRTPEALPRLSNSITDKLLWCGLSTKSAVWPEMCISLKRCLNNAASLPAFPAIDSIGVFALLVPTSSDCVRLLSKAYGLQQNDPLRHDTQENMALANVQSPDFTYSFCDKNPSFIFDSIVNIENYLTEQVGLDNEEDIEGVDPRKLFYKFIARM